MKKCLIFILILALLCPVSASAAESCKYLALIFEGSPRDTETLLTGLEARNARVTFFFGEGDGPEAETLRSYGHELGIRTDAGQDMSRRQIAAELQDQERRLNGRVRLLQTTAGCSDGLRQVARAMGFSFVEPSGELRLLSAGEDGEVLLVGGKIAAITLLEWVDDLQDQGFVFVTVSELARRRGISLRAGEVYRSFPRPDRHGLHNSAPGCGRGRCAFIWWDSEACQDPADRYSDPRRRPRSHSNRPRKNPHE